MRVATINDFLGGQHASLLRAGVTNISSKTQNLYHFADYPPEPYNPQQHYDIITININKINKKTVNYYTQLIESKKPNMIFITSSYPAYVTLNMKKQFQEVINLIEDKWNYIIAGYKPKRFNMHTFMIDPSDFGSNITEGNTYIIGFHKDIYMDHAKTIRDTPIPTHKNHIYPSPIKEKLHIPLHEPEYYLSQKQANHLKTKQANYIIINNEQYIPALTIEEMLEQDEYTLVQDDAWQINQIYPVNREGLRFPHQMLYAKLRGYIGYSCRDDAGNDFYDIYYPTKVDIGEMYVHAIDLHPLIHITEKYVNKLRELNRKI